MKSWYWFTACGVISALAVGSYFFDLPAGRETILAGAGQEIAVRLIQVRRASLPRRIKVNGELRPGGVFDIASPLAGKVTEVRFKVGDFVNAGERVATVEADGLEQRIGARETGIRAARQELQARERELAEAETLFAAKRELLHRDLIPRRDLERAESAAATSRAQAELARARLAQQEAMLAQLRALRDLTRLVAPVSGWVSHRFVEPGAVVGEHGAIMTLGNMDTLRLIGEVSGDDAQGLRSGQIAEVSSAALRGVTAEGKVTQLEPQSGGTASSYVIEIVFANARRVFRLGMAAEAWIDLDAQGQALFIPRSAIVLENKRAAVFKFRDGRALRQEIMLGRLLGDEVEVVQGLTERDSVIVDDPKKLAPGTRVRAPSGRDNR